MAHAAGGEGDRSEPSNRPPCTPPYLLPKAAQRDSMESPIETWREGRQESRRAREQLRSQRAPPASISPSTMLERSHQPNLIRAGWPLGQRVGLELAQQETRQNSPPHAALCFGVSVAGFRRSTRCQKSKRDEFHLTTQWPGEGVRLQVCSVRFSNLVPFW